MVSGRAPRPPATAWRLLGGLLCLGSADAPAPYAAERSRSRCAPQATRGRRAAARACTGMQALHGASATRCGSGGCRCGGATHAAVDQRERALKLSAADGGQQRVCAAGRRGSGQHLAHCFRARAKVPKSAVKVRRHPKSLRSSLSAACATTRDFASIRVKSNHRQPHGPARERLTESPSPHGGRRRAR